MGKKQRNNNKGGGASGSAERATADGPASSSDASGAAVSGGGGRASEQQHTGTPANGGLAVEPQYSLNLVVDEATKSPRLQLLVSLPGVTGAPCRVSPPHSRAQAG